jgi:hypothetical protein
MEEELEVRVLVFFVTLRLFHQILRKNNNEKRNTKFNPGCNYISNLVLLSVCITKEEEKEEN